MLSAAEGLRSIARICARSERSQAAPEERAGWQKYAGLASSVSICSVDDASARLPVVDDRQLSHQRFVVGGVIRSALCRSRLSCRGYVLSQEQALAAQRLAAYDNVQGIGPLAEALEWPDPAIRATASRSLVRLLPLLNASDTGVLTSAQRGCLHRMLRMGNAQKHEALIRAILKALEQVGDEAAVPYVKQLASGYAKTRAQQRVQDCAKECLPFLEAGANQRLGSQTLLRASSATGAAQPDILLRPAAEATVSESTQLLRAGSEDE